MMLDSDASGSKRQSGRNYHHGLGTWLLFGLLFQIVFHHHQSPLNPMAWIHVLLWPVFLVLIALKWAVVAVVGLLLVGYLVMRR